MDVGGSAPPSNDIVCLKAVAGYPLREPLDSVWVTGVIGTQAYLNDVGDAGCAMQATIIDPYRAVLMHPG